MATAGGSGENHSLAKFQHDFVMRWNHLSGNTALHEAAWKGYSQTIEILAKHKVNLNIKNKNGNTALHLACQQGHNQSCRNLLIYGAKPDIKNNYGDTPLHTAARYGHAGVVRILISAFCNVNEVNKNGDTALHISSAMGRRKLTRILLETGCNPAIKNKQGETAMDISLRKNFKEVQEIIAATPVKDPPQSKRHKQKNGSLQSQGSRQSREERHKVKVSPKDKSPYHSPYGCPMLPDSKEFPQPRISSLPAEPLRKGEQYYIDLAGNIRKGPVGKVYNCYCVPLIEKVEKKLEKEKRELKEEIENCRTNLNDKISSLERKTNCQMFSLNETVKSRLSAERIQCVERNQRSNLKQKLDYERSRLQQVEQFKNQMKCLLESRLNQPKTTNPRKYQPNPARHTNKSYPSGLTIQGNHNNGNQGSSNGTINSNAVNYRLPPDDNNFTYDRPKSCLSYNKDFVTTMATYYNEKNGVILNKPVRSKSETHLSVAQGETIGTSDNSQPGCSGYIRNANGVCIGTTQAEVYYDATHSCSEDSEDEDEEKEMSIKSQNNKTSNNNSNTRSNNNSNGDTINTNNNVNQIVNNNENDGGDNCVNSTSVHGDVKNIYDLPTHSQPKMVTVEGERSQSIKVINDCNDVQIECKPVQQLPTSQSTSSHCPPEDIVDHSDLMKSLRCNVTPRGNNDYRNSPFSDSGFRSKYSPSPREGTLTDGGIIYPEPKIHTREPYIASNNPPINLPSQSISQLHDQPLYRREPIPTRLNMATPASSLV